MATQETQRAVAALDLADYRNYVNTITAADAEIRASQFADAREQLLTVPVARRGWEWAHLFLRAEKTLLTVADRAPCTWSENTGLGGVNRGVLDTLVKDPDGKHVYFRYCNRVNVWNTETLEHSVVGPTPGNVVAAARSGRSIEYSSASDEATPWPERKWNVYAADSIGRQLPKLIGTVERQPGCADLSRDGRILALGLRPLVTAAPTGPFTRSNRHFRSVGWRTPGIWRETSSPKS
jgi:hypothetical protein